MGRKASTKIKVVLEIASDDHQKLSHASFNNGKSVNDYALLLIEEALIAQNLKPKVETTPDLFKALDTAATPPVEIKTEEAPAKRKR